MQNQEANAGLPVADSSSTTWMQLYDVNYVWTIENFSNHLEAGHLCSPLFSAQNDSRTQWSLLLYPSGQDDENKDYISLFLVIGSRETSEILVDLEFSILHTAKEKAVSMSTVEPKMFDDGVLSWGPSRFIKREHLFQDYDGFLPGDKLAVSVTISYAKDTTLYSTKMPFDPPEYPKCDLSKVLGEVFEKQTYSDLVLAVNGKEIRAHKAILAARSPVLKAIFARDLNEEMTSRIEIRDLNEDTLTELMRFIYTGRSENLEKMSELLATIEKHVLVRATEKATQTLDTNLGMSQASDSNGGRQEEKLSGSAAVEE